MQLVGWVTRKHAVADTKHYIQARVVWSHIDLAEYSQVVVVVQLLTNPYLYYLITQEADAPLFYDRQTY